MYKKHDDLNLALIILRIFFYFLGSMFLGYKKSSSLEENAPAHKMSVKIAKLVVHVYMVDTLKLSEIIMSEKQELPSSNRVNREWGLKPRHSSFYCLCLITDDTQNQDALMVSLRVQKRLYSPTA